MKKFENPDFEILDWEIIDVITTSDDEWIGEEGENDLPWA